MSALGSSVINKSGKKFAPKAPARRTVASVPAQSSTRPSVDRQLQSHTPQPAYSHIATSSAQFPPPSTPLSIQPPVIAPQASIFQRDTATPILVPSRNISARQYTTPTSVVPQKRALEPSQGSHQSAPIIHPSQASHICGPADEVLKPEQAICRHEEVISTSNSLVAPSKDGADPNSRNRPHHSDLMILSGTRDVPDAEPSERPRRENSQDDNHTCESLASDTSSNVPLPNTEINGGNAEGSNTNEALSDQLHARGKRKTSSHVKKKPKQHTKAATADGGVGTITSRSSKTKGQRKGAKCKGTKNVKGTTPGSQEYLGPVGTGAVPAKAKRKYVKRNTTQHIESATADVVEHAMQASSEHSKRRGKKSKRVVTPEGADSIIILPSEVRMADLCKDGGTGRKSEREKELQELEQAEFTRRKQRQLQEIVGQIEPSVEADPSRLAEAREQGLGHQGGMEESVLQHVPNTIIVDGQIQIDEASLQIDRHAAAALERNAEQLDFVEENDMTRRINAGTWLRRDQSGGWNELLTERFYDGLRMFGTDFEMISKMFPGRTRHKVKLKFTKEEKLNYERIKATLLGERMPVDLPELEKMAGTEFDDPKELERDIEEDRKRLEEETAAEKQAMEDSLKERDEAIEDERAVARKAPFSKEITPRNNAKKGDGRKKDASRKKKRRANSAGENALGDGAGIPSNH